MSQNTTCSSYCTKAATPQTEFMDVTSSKSLASTQSRPILILGGSGFIGTRLSGLLTERDVPVRIGDLRPSESFPNCWVRCDVRQHESVSEVAHGAYAIVNLAAEHRDDVRPLSRYHETNVQGASQVCLAAPQCRNPEDSVHQQRRS